MEINRREEMQVSHLQQKGKGLKNGGRLGVWVELLLYLECTASDKMRELG